MNALPTDARTRAAAESTYATLARIVGNDPNALFWSSRAPATYESRSVASPIACTKVAELCREASNAPGEFPYWLSDSDVWFSRSLAISSPTVNTPRAP